MLCSQLRWMVRGVLWLLGGLLLSGCTTAMVFLHVQSKVNEGGPAPCVKLNTVERALSPRCGDYVPGSLAVQDVAHPGLPECPLTLAARDPQFWPVLPELMVRGARTDFCQTPPVVALAQQSKETCPPFDQASTEVLRAFTHLAEDDPRALHHDSLRILSCPQAQRVGLDSVLSYWRTQGRLVPRQLAFSPFSAMHPSYLNSLFSRKLETTGHDPRQAFQGRDEGQLTPGFEEALRTSDWQALAWWLERMPELIQGVPAMRGKAVGWLPLARTLSPGFMPAAQQGPMIDFLLARGANPWQRLPHAPNQSVVQYAQQIQSPWVDTLNPPLFPERAQAQAMH